MLAIVERQAKIGEAVGYDNLAMHADAPQGPKHEVRIDEATVTIVSRHEIRNEDEFEVSVFRPLALPSKPPTLGANRFMRAIVRDVDN